MGTGSMARTQVNVSLSDRAMTEYQTVSTWLGIPVRTLLRQILEGHHQSASFANLLKRARAGEVPPEKEPLTDEDD